MSPASLRERVRGTIVGRGDADYEAQRQSVVWNQLQPTHGPEIIVRPVDDGDVVECVRFARAQGLRIAVRGSGHNWCGAALQPGSLLIDLSRLRDVAIDADARTASAQPGIPNAELCRVLSAHGFAFPYGHCPTVALSGYLLSGGFGWNAGAWGPACFSVRAAEIVTAEGRLITADETRNEDFFWAVRGAGAGFFGVVTRYHLALQSMPRAIVGSTFVYPLELLPAVAAWQSALVGALSNRVEVGLFVASAPAGLAGPGGGMVCVLEAQAFADIPDEAAALLAILESEAAPRPRVAQRVRQPLTYDDLFDSMAQRFPEKHRYLADTFLSHTPPANTLGAVSGVMSRAPSDRSLLLCVQPPPPPADGSAPPDTAFSIAAPVFLICYAIWDSPAADDINRAWHSDVVARLEPCSTYHYIGETDLNRPSRARRSFAPANWERLQALRAMHDPDHLFHSILDQGS